VDAGSVPETVFGSHPPDQASIFVIEVRIAVKRIANPRASVDTQIRPLIDT
jgi:hypothetical protein